jgi:hypothetical protein
MTVYRIYLLDRYGRNKTGFNAVFADDEAIRAHMLLTIKPKEQADIWAGMRYLGTVRRPEDDATGVARGPAVSVVASAP